MPIPDDDEQHESTTWDPAGPAGLDCRARLGRRPPDCVRSSMVTRRVWL